MRTWLQDLRRERERLVAAASDQVVSSGCDLAPHEADYLASRTVTATLLSLGQGRPEPLVETLTQLAEREARVGRPARAEAVVRSIDAIEATLQELLASTAAKTDLGVDPTAVFAVARTSFLSAYLRGKAEEDRRQQRALDAYAATSETVPPLVYSTDALGHITDISNAAAQLLGYSKEALIGTHCSVLMTDEDAARFRHFLQERRTDERATRGARMTLRCADGSHREFEVSSTGVYTPGGEYVGADGIARPVSGESAASLRYQLDAAGRFQEISESAAAILGYTREELLGQHFTQVMDQAEQQRVGHQFGERRQDERAAHDIRVVLTGRDGLRREFEITASGRYGADGQFVGTDGRGRDLTARAEMERQVTEGRRRLRAVVNAAGVGLAVISPDLVVREVNNWHRFRWRRPVIDARCHVSFFGLAEPCPWCGLKEAWETGRPVRRDEVLNPLDGRRYQLQFQTVTDEHGDTAAVVESMTDISDAVARHLAAGEQDKFELLQRMAQACSAGSATELTCRAMQGDRRAATEIASWRRWLTAAGLGDWLPGSCAVAGVVEDLFAETRARYPAHDWDCDLLPGLPPVAVRACTLRAILLPLLVNAAEAEERGGEVTVEAATDGLDQAIIRVTDTGCGMSAKTLRRASEPGFSGHGRGEGWGLALATGLVRQAGGRLTVASREGAGATVEVSLPLAGEPEPTRPTSAGPWSVWTANERLSAAIADWLSAAGHEATVAAGPPRETAGRWLAAWPGTGTPEGSPTLWLADATTATTGAVPAVRLPFGPDDLVTIVKEGS